MAVQNPDLEKPRLKNRVESKNNPQCHERPEQSALAHPV
jgi:hypothetical protein